MTTPAGTRRRNGAGPQSESEGPTLPPADPRSAQTVLIVDDDPNVRNVLRTGLEAAGYRVHAATDGLDALERVAEAGPDAMVLDVALPRMDGLTVLRRVRASNRYLPVLLLTSRTAVGDRVTGLDSGADDYLTKPFDVDELVARVRALLRRGALPTHAAQAVPSPRDVVEC